VKAIIFDWDNTIVKSFDYLVLYHQKVSRQLGWPPVTDEQIRAVWGRPFEELIQALWPKCNSKDFYVAYQRHILSETVPEVEGAVAAITKLQGLFLLGIVTAAPRFEVEHFLAQLGLNKADFFLIQAADESKYHKPDPRVFDILITLLRERNIGKSEILYIGDSLIDFYAARYAFLQFIAVLTGSTNREQFQAAGVSTQDILKSIIELPRRLKYYCSSSIY
jgi:HAD superfamily hydrolase (TIGR01549 family)